MKLNAGMQLGAYQIVAPLGAGGMGEVYRATDTRLDRDVALKVLPAEVADDRAAQARFEREAKAIAALSHPNILAVYDVGRDRGVSFVVTELLDGETLRARLDLGPIASSKAIAYATQLAEGLAAAHSRGIVHRDLKPENVFLTRDGRVKLLDFGLAQTADGGAPPTDAETRPAVTAAHAVLGTVGYMSPEQARGERAEASSDVFSFGVVLHEMLSGRRAFEGRTAIEVLSAVLRDDPPALAQSGVHVPPRLERIVRRCLEKIPGERFQSARDLAFALSDALDAADAPSPSAARGELSVVVLPFANLSPDPDDAFLADGFTEEAISDLSAVGSLKVISRTSAMRLKGADKDATTIARELGVQYVLEGSVRRSGDTLRVTARLVDADADRQLWTDRYSGMSSDIFAIQERVARSIVEALNLRLTERERESLGTREVTDPRAYESYVRARSVLYAFSVASLTTAQRHLENALAMIGDHESLLALLGRVYAFYGYAGAPPALDRAEDCASRISRLNADSPHGVLIRAWVLVAQGDLRRAIPELERAHRAFPADADVMVLLFALQVLRGTADGAGPLLRRLLEIDPLTPMTQSLPGLQHIFAGRFEQAIPFSRRFQEMDPQNPVALWGLAWALLHARRIAEAEPFVERLEATTPDSPYLSIARAELWGARGERDRALSAITPGLVDAAANNELFSRELINCYALAERRDEAIRWLENTVRIGVINYPYWSRHNWMIDGLRGDPRFHEILARVREEWAQGVSTAEAVAYPLQDRRPRPVGPRSSSAVPSSSPVVEAAKTPERSIVVLPFANLSAEPEDAYFSDGLTEELITDLSRLRGLRLVPSAATFRLKNADRTPQDIAGEFKARYVLTGRVRKVGNNVRVNAELIDTQDERSVWADRYTGTLENTFDVQEQISQGIAGSLELRFEPPRREPDPKAREAYRRGRHFFRHATNSGTQRAVACYEDAVGIDPDYGAAFAALAEAYVTLTQGWDAQPARTTMPRARAAAERALTLDAGLAEAHTAMGLVATFYDWDLTRAEGHFKEALRLNPSYTEACRWYAALLIWLDTRYEDALQVIERGLEHDPSDPWLKVNRCWVYGFSRDVTRWVDEARRVVTDEPVFGFGHYALGCALIAAGRHRDAIESLSRGIELDGRGSHQVALLGMAYALDGQEARAQECLEELDALEQNGRDVAVWKLHLHAGRGDAGAVLRCLERAIDARSTATIFVLVHPFTDFVADDPRFHALLRRAGVEYLIGRPRLPRWNLAFSRSSALDELEASSVLTVATPVETTTSEGPSIAVLPFVNLSADPEQEYFSDGLADEIINALTRVPGLSVMARTSSFAFRGKDGDIRRIAEALGVRTILAGSVRRAGTRVRVAAQLVDAETGYYRWSERYERELVDVFAIQDEIADAVSVALQGRLLGGGAAPLRQHVPPLPAYEAYLRGRREWALLTPDSLTRAVAHFEEAIALDPDFALAHWAFGYCFMLLTWQVMPAREAMPRARASAERALRLDPSLAGAHALLGTVSTLFDYDFTEADRHFRAAMPQEPVPPEIRREYGYSLMLWGRPREAAVESERAVSDDPLNTLTRYLLADCFLARGAEADAVAQLRRALELDPSYWLAHFRLAALHAVHGALDEALASAERASERGPSWTVALVAAVAARMGDRHRAETLVQRLRTRKPHGMAGGLTWFHAITGEHDRAQDWLEQMIEERDPWALVWGRVLFSVFGSGSLRPRLARMMNLPA